MEPPFRGEGEVVGVIDDTIRKNGGTAAAAPPPFRPSKPALCGSCPLVTPY